MHFVIMGCGRVGSTLTRSLERRGHTVAIIDTNPDAFRRLGPDFAGMTIKGFGFDRNVLVKAKIKQADGFAAVSSGDNSNILAARVVRESFGVENVVARIYDQDRAEVYERLGIATVATVRWASDQTLRRLLPEASEPLWRDKQGAVRLVELPFHPGWVGRSVADLQTRSGCQIPFLVRFGTGMVPAPATLIQDGDQVMIACEASRQPEIEAVLSNPPAK